MTTEVRRVRIVEQIAHLKVLLAVAEAEVVKDQRAVADWTQKILVDEAQVATFKFRIHDFEDELDELNAKLPGKSIKPRTRL